MFLACYFYCYYYDTNSLLFSLFQVLKIVCFLIFCKAIITGGISTRRGGGVGGGVLMGQSSLLGFSRERKFQGNFSAGYFPEGSFIEPSKSFSNSANFQYSQNAFNVASTNYSSQYKSFKIVKIIKRSQNTFYIVIDLFPDSCLLTLDIS